MTTPAQNESPTTPAADEMEVASECAAVEAADFVGESDPHPTAKAVRAARAARAEALRNADDALERAAGARPGARLLSASRLLDTLAGGVGAKPAGLAALVTVFAAAIGDAVDARGSGMCGRLDTVCDLLEILGDKLVDKLDRIETAIELLDDRLTEICVVAESIDANVAPAVTDTAKAEVA